MDYKDYYQILGVPRDADAETIRKAYRKLAKKYHPDANPNDKAAEARFKEINEANAVLSDADKRAKYDRFGRDWERYQQAGATGGFDWSQYTRSNPRAYTYTYSGDDPFSAGTGNFSSFFEMLFGAGRRGGMGDFGTTSQQTSRPAAAEINVRVTLQEVLHGTTRLLEREGGTREVKIPPGVKTGSKIRLAGEGNSGPFGERGDLYLVIDVLPDPLFERKDDDLYLTFNLPLTIAVLGGEVEISTLEGPVSLRVPPETQNGAKFRLRGKGLPNLKDRAQRGDLYATARVVLPTRLNAEERALFERLRQLGR
jgi:curved DNA-binding protein